MQLCGQWIADTQHLHSSAGAADHTHTPIELRCCTHRPETEHRAGAVQVPVSMQVRDSWLPVELPTGGSAAPTPPATPPPVARVTSPGIPDDWVLHLGSVTGADWPSPNPRGTPSPNPRGSPSPGPDPRVGVCPQSALSVSHGAACQCLRWLELGVAPQLVTAGCMSSVLWKVRSQQ